MMRLAIFLMISYLGLSSCSSSATGDGGAMAQESTEAETAKYEYSGGAGTIAYNTSEDELDRTYFNVTNLVWEFCREHADANELTVILTDKCKDLKGNISEYKTNIEFTGEQIKEYSTYQDPQSFGENCSEYAFKFIFEWKPCGRARFN